MIPEPETTDYGQPIETAPRDGSKIQVRSVQSGKWHTAKWDPEGDSWADEFGIACEAGCGTIQVTGYWASGGGWFQPNEVDRWKPLVIDDDSQTTEDILRLADTLCKAACEIWNQWDPCAPYMCPDGTEIPRRAAPSWAFDALGEAADNYYVARNRHEC